MLADIQPGVGDAFVRGILPVNDAELATFYQEGLFPSLGYGDDQDGDGTLEGCGDGSGHADSSNLINLLEDCRQLIVDDGVGASERVFLFGWLAGNPTSHNGCAPVPGQVAYGNTQATRYQRTFAHEFTHNFGFNHNASLLDEVGWDVGGRLAGNPAGNNVAGRVKPTTFFDLHVPAKFTDEAWIKTGADDDGYNELLNHPTLAAAGGDFSARVLVIQGIFDEASANLVRLRPAFRYPWLSRPTRQPRPPNTPGFQQQTVSRFLAQVTDVTGRVTTATFSALVGNDIGDRPDANGAELRPTSMLKDLFMQAQFAARNSRTPASDLLALTRLFELLNGDGPNSRCGPPPKPDLTPEPRVGSDGTPVPGPNGFCRRDVAGNLIVRVRNLGSGAAGPSVTRVVFETPSGNVTVTVATESIPPFGFKDVVIPIPPGSFDPDSNFTITVDSGLTVTESNEGNNIKIGICIG